MVESDLLLPGVRTRQSNTEPRGLPLLRARSLPRRRLPYDPVRPWKDTDGKWYYGLSTDGCNATTKNTPCAAGGQLELFTADSFMGPWTQLAPMFTTNTTVSGGKVSPGAITREFVTSGYFGALPGDPAGGKTRVLTQNNGGPTYWVGAQSNGGPFRAYWDRPGAVGHYDYGSLTMARTLGGDPDQVVGAGRKVLVGWIGCAAPRRPTEHKPGAKQKTSAASPPCVARTETFASIATALLCHSREPRGTVRRSGGNRASQSLGRDLSLSSGYELLQQFVPELAGLRGKHTRTSAVRRPAARTPYCFSQSRAGPSAAHALGSRVRRDRSARSCPPRCSSRSSPPSR